jgi:hypothetical protein
MAANKMSPPIRVIEPDNSLKASQTQIGAKGALSVPIKAASMAGSMPDRIAAYEVKNAWFRGQG